MEHLCSQAGQDWKQFHSEPGNPVIDTKVIKIKSDDSEGSIHHDVLHHKIDVQSLEKMTNEKQFFHHKM